MLQRNFELTLRNPRNVEETCVSKFRTSPIFHSVVWTVENNPNIILKRIRIIIFTDKKEKLYTKMIIYVSQLQGLDAMYFKRLFS